MAESPGGVEEGRVSIRVTPDTSKFAADLRADLAKIKIDFAIKVDLDNSGLDEKARLAADEAQKAAGKIDIRTNVDTSQIAELDRGLSAGAQSGDGLLGSLSGMGPAIAVAVLAAAAIAPALALTLPVLAFIGAGVGVIALALGGLGKVFAPLVAGFKSLQLPITALVTSGLAPLVKTFTANVIPVLKTGFSAVAVVINGVITALLQLGQSTAFLSGLKTLLVGSAAAFAPLVKTIPLVATAFLQIANAALPALAQLTSSFASVLTGFATSISKLAASGQLTSIISNAAAALSALGGVGGAVLKALLQVGVALAPAFTALANALIPVVNALGPVLAGEVAVLAPALIQLVQVLGPAFAKTLTALAPSLTQLAAQFAKTTIQVLPLLPPLLSLADKVLPLIATALNGPTIAMLRLIGAVAQAITTVASFATQLSGDVAKAISAAKTKVGELVTAFANLPATITSAVGDLSGTLVQAGKDVISGLVKGIGQATVGPLKSALAGVGDFIKDHKGPPSVDKVLLVPAGQQIMGGLIAGLESQLPALESSLGRITKAVKPPSMTGVFDGAAGGAGISGTTVVVQGDVGWSLEKFTQAVDQKARDAQTVANLRLALVG